MVCVYILCHQDIRDQGDMFSDFIEREEESNSTIEIYLSKVIRYWYQVFDFSWWYGSKRSIQQHLVFSVEFQGENDPEMG